jgi:hypothetical protein
MTTLTELIPSYWIPIIQSAAGTIIAGFLFALIYTGAEMTSANRDAEDRRTGCATALIAIACCIAIVGLAFVLKR